MKATDCETNDVIYFNSMYSVQQHLGVCPSIVKRVCDGDKYRKTGISKRDGQSY